MIDSHSTEGTDSICRSDQEDGGDRERGIKKKSANALSDDWLVFLSFLQEKPFLLLLSSSLFAYFQKKKQPKRQQGIKQQQYDIRCCQWCVYLSAESEEEGRRRSISSSKTSPFTFHIQMLPSSFLRIRFIDRVIGSNREAITMHSHHKCRNAENERRDQKVRVIQMNERLNE